jgi:hypothetical protein
LGGFDVTKQCSHTNRLGWGQLQCNKFAKTEHKGKPYCGLHDPIKVKSRRDKQDAKSQAATDRRIAVLHREIGIRKAKENLIATARLAVKQQASWDDVAAAVSALDVMEA